MTCKAINTDLYQLTMLASYFHQGMHEQSAVCEMFVRRLPENRNFLLAAGLKQVTDYLSDLKFTDAQIEHLKTIPALRKAMNRGFVEYLRGFRFTGMVHAMPEGTAFFANEPIVRVEAPLGQAQLVETFILSTINHQTMIASKAARMVLAAHGKPLLEFGTRRTGSESAVLAARAAYIAGFEGTSNVEASYTYDVPARGTMAHMYIMASKDEKTAFKAYADTFGDSTYLVDTYDISNGIRNALEAAGDNVKAIRIDSGDLAKVTVEARGLLDSLGREDVKIILSSDLDEYALYNFSTDDVPYDGAGIGTKLVASEDAPSLGGVYKLVQIEGRPVAKFSANKVTYPGPKQVYRKKNYSKDLLGLSESSYDFLDCEKLLVPVMIKGKAIHDESISAMRTRARNSLKSLPDSLKAIKSTQTIEPYKVEPTVKLLKMLDNCRIARESSND